MSDPTTKLPVPRLNFRQDVIRELDQLKSYGVTVSEAAYTHARQTDIRLLSLLEPRDAALLLLRRSTRL